MIEETETREVKGDFDWSAEGQQFDLLKTVVAFANTSGGSIHIERFRCDEAKLDSARLDDFVNKYVSPPLHGISSLITDTKGCKITVAKSAFAPHAIKAPGEYFVNGKKKPAFHLGQVYVRHSTKSEPATGEDLQRLIRESVSGWLTQLGEAMGKVTISGSDIGAAMPVRMVEGGPGLSISFAESHPYRAGDLGAPFGKTGAWIGKLINKEGMRADLTYCRRLPMFTQSTYAFSDAAKERVAKILTDNPEYNPYSKN